MKIVICLLLSCLLAAANTSPLTFESHLVTVNAPADAKEVKAKFTFTNNSTETITVKKMDAPCSCLSATITPKSYLADGIKPGESGTITGVFQLGTFKGTVKKSIALWTDEGNAPSIFLEAEVVIPVLFEIEPKTLIWDVGETHEPKSYTIKVNHTEPINIVSHRSTNTDYPYTITPIKEGWEYKVTVDPVSCESPGIGIISFKTDCKIPKHRKAQAFVVVKKQRPKS